MFDVKYNVLCNIFIFYETGGGGLNLRDVIYGDPL